MLRAFLTTLVTVTGMVLLLSGKPHQAPRPIAEPIHQSADPGATTPANGPVPTSTTVTGDLIDTRYGPVQVAITMAGSRITAVEVPLAPSGNGRDRQITSFAVPQLVEETMSAQNAHIDVVSGATYTSEGYISSLQSALDKAGA
ncbi:FMN-binding protein [Herbidospora mongoliensis]|uniref:FMN-binding protein n=1 Tax=Herbidospora mongoliensis TaxID=688067 RepID=UPI000A3F0D9B|nr:FMN-binding protein [Herbidospora mongoliensis]